MAVMADSPHLFAASRASQHRVTVFDEFRLVDGGEFLVDAGDQFGGEFGGEVGLA